MAQFFSGKWSLPGKLWHRRKYTKIFAHVASSEHVYLSSRVIVISFFQPLYSLITPRSLFLLHFFNNASVFGSPTTCFPSPFTIKPISLASYLRASSASASVTMRNCGAPLVPRFWHRPSVHHMYQERQVYNVYNASDTRSPKGMYNSRIARFIFHTHNVVSNIMNTLIHLLTYNHLGKSFFL